MNVIAGEPVPPGFEDDVNRVAEIQKTIELYNAKALIGLEYTLELHEEDRREPGYLCILCDKRGDPRTIISHWTSFNHRIKYLEKHFPTAVREFNAIRYKPNSHIIINQIVQTLTKAIEERHGRLAVSVYNADDFRRMKSQIFMDVAAKLHFDERAGPNFINFIDRTLWENDAPESNDAEEQAAAKQTLQITIKNTKRSSESGERDEELDEISSDSDGDANSAKKAKLRQQSPAYRVRAQNKENNSKSVPIAAEKKLLTPKELSLQASHIAQERYKWEKYRCMLEIQLNQMQKLQQDYEVNPEKHPMYPDEWKKFWNRRYKELQEENKVDPNKYDYKPEWIAYWTKRMKELYDSDMAQKKKDIKIKLGLPEDAEERVDQLRERYKVQVAPSRAARANVKPPAGGVDVIDISDDESTLERRSRSRRTRTRSRSRTNSRGRRSHSRSRRSYSSSVSPSRSHHYARRTRDSRSKSPLAKSYSVASDADAADYFERQRYRPSHHHQHHHHHVASEASEYYAGHTRARYPAAAASHGYGHVSLGRGGGYRVLDPHHMPKYVRSPSPHSSASTGLKVENSQEMPTEDEGPLTVVAVLRLLIALEEHLGSLGHKVVDMLGKALALEKIKANSADDLLLNEDHCVFFETIKEKLKGLLIADVIEDAQKIRACKKAIRNIASVIHQVTNSDKGKFI